MLDKTSRYEIISIESSPTGSGNKKLLILDRTTETGEPFIVIAGYFLGAKKEYEDESVLAEIETVPVGEYSKLKNYVREKSAPQRKKASITFW
jgi:hypothetical protein